MASASAPARTAHSSAIGRSPARYQWTATSAAGWVVSGLAAYRLGHRAGPVQLTQTAQVSNGAGQGGMQPAPFAGQQVSVHNFTDQGVPDVVAVLAGPGHQ